MVDHTQHSVRWILLDAVMRMFIMKNTNGPLLSDRWAVASFSAIRAHSTSSLAISRALATSTLRQTCYRRRWLQASQHQLKTYNIIAYHSWGRMHCVLTWCTVNQHSIYTIHSRSPDPSGRAASSIWWWCSRSAGRWQMVTQEIPSPFAAWKGSKHTDFFGDSWQGICHGKIHPLLAEPKCNHHGQKSAVKWKITYLNRPRWIVQAWNSQCSISFDTSSKQLAAGQFQKLPGAQCRNASNKGTVNKGTMWSIIRF